MTTIYRTQQRAVIIDASTFLSILGLVVTLISGLSTLFDQTFRTINNTSKSVQKCIFWKCLMWP